METRALAGGSPEKGARRKSLISRRGDFGNVLVSDERAAGVG
jgi:hypothetical protein